MARKAELFEDSGRSVVRAYLMLKANGSANIPPNWIERAKESRKRREIPVAEALTAGSVRDYPTLEDWELAYQKECFYYGLRALLELERHGRTSY